MENLISSNLETIGATVMLCREKGYCIKDVFEKLFPKTIEQLNLNVDDWSSNWEKLTIATNKKDFDEFSKMGIKCISIISLGDEEYRKIKFEKINKIIEQLN